eukprot:540244-Amphidinium_carterae.1
MQGEPSLREQRECENEVCRAGLRNAARAVLSAEALCKTMGVVRQALLLARTKFPQASGLSRHKFGGGRSHSTTSDCSVAPG